MNDPHRETEKERGQVRSKVMRENMSRKALP